MQSVTPTAAERNRTRDALNMTAAHLSDRAAKLVTRRVVDGMGIWRVKSQTTADETYVVTLAEDGAPVTSCSCPDFRHRGLECKHIKVARTLFGSAQPAEATAPAQVAQPVPASPAPIVWTSDSRRNRRRTEPVEEL